MLQPDRHKSSWKPVIKGQILPFTAQKEGWGRDAFAHTQAQREQDSSSAYCLRSGANTPGRVWGPTALAASREQVGIFALAEQPGWSTRAAPCLPGYPQKGNLIVYVQNNLVTLQKSKYPREEGSAGRGHTHKGSVVHQIKLAEDDKKVHRTLWEQVARTAVRVFLLFFFALPLFYILEAWKHPVLDVSRVSTRVIRREGQITGLLVHTQRSLLCPYKRCFPRKWRIGKAFFKIKPKSNHLEKKFKIHSKVLKKEEDFGLTFGQV